MDIFNPLRKIRQIVSQGNSIEKEKNNLLFLHSIILTSSKYNFLKIDRTRFVSGNVDLDLTYITDNIIGKMKKKILNLTKQNTNFDLF